MKLQPSKKNNIQRCKKADIRQLNMRQCIFYAVLNTSGPIRLADLPQFFSEHQLRMLRFCSAECSYIAGTSEHVQPMGCHLAASSSVHHRNENTSHCHLDLQHQHYSHVITTIIIIIIIIISLCN